MQILSMRFRSAKPMAELEAMTEGSLGLFQALPGLVQKYYVANRDNDEIGGIYLFESADHLNSYLNGPIVAEIPRRFACPEPPRAEILDVTHHIVPSDESASDRAASWIGSVRFVSGLDLARLREMSAESVDHFAALPGMVEAFRVASAETGRVGGIYVWDDEKYVDALFGSPEVKGIPEKYAAVGAVELEPLKISRTLRS